MITTASADALARLLDEEHYELSRRVPPAGDAHRNRGADDDPTEGDPPARVPGQAIAHGIRSAPSTPPLIGGRPTAPVNLYAEAANVFDAAFNHRGNTTHRAGSGRP